MTKRAIKPVSFSGTDYEQGLLSFATRDERGPFSQYVKRLIHQDRIQQAIQEVAPVHPVYMEPSVLKPVKQIKKQVKKETPKIDEEEDFAKGFLL